MSMDVWSLIEAQQEIHGRISRCMDNLKKLGTSHISVSSIEARIGIIDSLWKKAEAQHDAIRTGLKDKFNESEYAQSDLIEEIESTYVLQKSLLGEYAEDLRAASPAKHDQSRENAVKTSLPRIKLQTFSGAYEDWPSFRDLFFSVIGENPSISNVERFHYLRSCVKGAAEKLIRSLTVTSENYRRAWSILCEHYENKRELIRSNFASFTAVPKMKGESAEELSRIHNAVMTAVNAQESIGRPINSHGMDLFNFLIVELLDSRTRMEWESSTSDSTEPPDHDTLLHFITKRILTLNAAKPKAASKGCGDTSRSVKSLHTKHSVDHWKCALCQGKHSVMQCSEFKTKSAVDRKSLVESHRLCYNCLGNHLISKCQSVKTCLTCKAKHHTMLHDAYVSSNTNEVTTLSAVRRPSDRKAILLATARVNLADRVGDLHQIRALIDQGSEVSIISEALAQRLCLPRSRSAISIVGIGGTRSAATRGKVTLNLSSSVTGIKLTAVAHVLPRLSAYQGPIAKGSSSWPHIHGLTLADPKYF